MRISVSKTYKMYVNGAFVRSERGYVADQLDAKGNFVAHYPTASRKDFRDAVKAARSAQSGWAKRSAFNRSQILFRFAEMLEDRRAMFEQRLVELLGMKPQAAKQELDIAIDRTFFYAGWADKYGQVLSSVNPVAGPYFNFTTPEPTGVVGALLPASSPVIGLVSVLMSIILSGNTCILLADNAAPIVALELGETLALSDFPNGVVNILTGSRSELLTQFAAHFDVNAVAAFGLNVEEATKLQTTAADNMKRLHLADDNGAEAWRNVSAQSLYDILPYIEFKTAWHPMGV
jgi:acyl-CoA reductase-like NAD-dependent aldehyde dehydrogenase